MNEMTTRGTNPSSISPPVQIPQPRHVSTISSGTPPPNQLYPGQSPGLVQGPTFNYIQPQYQQGEQLLPYQAYGSAPNDLRGATSSSGRGGAGPANMAQSGTYYHQANQNMRPQQPPPPNHSQYYIGQTGQNNMRHPRPTNSAASNQPLMFIQPNPNNMVITTNMYQQTTRMPMYQQGGGPQYQTRFSQPTGMMYFNGVPRSSVPMQTQGMGPPPAPREKRLIKISDPNTGRNITDELLKSSHQRSSEEKSELDDSSTNNDKGVEIRKNFTRQVVERMKTEAAAAAAPNQPPAEPVNISPHPGNPPPQNQTSQDLPQMPTSYPPGPPQQPQSTPPLTGAPGPGSMMRPPTMRMGSPAINLSVPPPQLPPMYNNNRHAPNQQTMPGQLPVQSQHVMPSKGPVQTVPVADSAPVSRSVESTVSAPHDSVTDIERKVPASQIDTVIPQSDIPTQQELVTTELESTPPVQSKEVTPSQGPAKDQQNISQSSSHTKLSHTPQEMADTTVQPATVHSSVGSLETSASAPVVASVPEPVQQPTKAPESKSQSTTSAAAPAPSPAPTPVEAKHPKTEPASEPAPAAKPPTETPKKPVADAEVVNVGKEETVTGASTQGNKDGKKGKKNKKDFSRKESGGSEMDAFIDNSNITTNNGSERLAVSDTASKPTATQHLDETKTPKQVTNGDNLSTSSQVESKKVTKKKNKKKGKKAAIAPSKVKPEVANNTVNSIASPELKASENNAAGDSSPSESHSSEGKDSGVDSEPGQAVLEAESKSQKSDNEQQEILSKKKEPSPKAVESAVERATPEKESNTEGESDKKSDKVKNQNGADKSPDKKLPTEKQASVPKDNPPVVVNSVPEEIPDKASDIKSQVNSEQGQENGTPKIEEVEAEPSKAEEYAKLKKSGGKLVYDRAYLMELRGCASSQAKPDGLPALEIVLDQPSPYISRQSSHLVDFTPSFFQPGGNQRHPPPIGKSSSRGRQRPGDMPMTPRVIKSISMSNDTKTLHQSENPWKPSKKDDKDEVKSLEGEILFIMNRLTPTNFEKMAGEMKKLNVKTYEDLKFLVKVFFDKVTLETKFVEAYALLCKVMASLKVPPPADGTVKENMSTFRVVMLTKCQQEFEADKSSIFESPEDKKKKLEAENPEKTPERDEMIERTLYQMKLRRMKFYGNIRFIGELFKLSMLTESIMHDCIYRLLKARDDDSLVSLCNLLTTVGRNLDIDKAKPRMDQYFSQMGKIADERKSRIKFTLRDVIELRGNHWVPRKEAAGPKKIDEVHKDFAQEQARNQYLASQPPPPRPDNSQAGSRRGSRQRQEENKGGEDGWNTVGNTKSFRIDATKMKFSSKNQVVDDNIQLGPGGGVHKTLWGRGSHGGAQPSQDDRPSIGGNRFSALTSDDARRTFTRSPSRGEGSAGRGVRQGQTVGHGRGKIISRSSQDGDRSMGGNRYMGGRSQNSSRDSSWNRDDRRQFMGPRGSYERDNIMTRSDSGVRSEEFRAPAPPAVKQMSETEIETKAVNILDEYLNIRDLAEAKLCMKELSGQSHLYLVVTASINSVLEKREEARHMTGNYFHEIVKNNMISVDAYIKGLIDVLQYAIDMVVDIPTLWTCLAQVISPLLVGGSLPWSKLKQAFTPHLDNKHGAKLMAALLSQCVEKQGEKEVSNQWERSGLSWSTYLKADELNSFVSDKKLDFTLGGSAGVLPDLEKMIRSRVSDSELNSYIEKTVTGSKTEPSFIRSLTTAFVSSSIDNKNLNEDVIKNHKDVLQKYLGTVDLQLQALYAIQPLMAKLEHPSGLLTKLFELLYYEISVEEDAFYRWEKCNDPQEQEAKGSCLMQVRQFFIWLRENEEPES